MEKRALISLVLSFIVLLVWTTLFGPKQEQKPLEVEEPHKQQETAASQFDTIPIPESAAPQLIEQEEEQSTLPKIEEKVIKVETSLYRAVFSNTGSLIKSFKLKKYHQTTNPDSPLIELVDPKMTEGDFFEVTFARPSDQSGKKIIYQVNEESLDFAPGSPPRDLIFSSITPDGVSIIQTFRIYPDQYRIDLTVTLSNTLKKQIEGNLEARLRNLLPEKKKRYYSFLGTALLVDGKLQEIASKKLEEGKYFSGRVDWMAYEDEYFITAISPETPSQGSFKGRLLPSGKLESTYIAPPISLKPHEQIPSRFMLYLGPRDLRILKQLGNKLDLAINFGWTNIIAKPLLYSLRFFNQYVNNYGVSIILLTVLIKILFWPLTRKSYQSMKAMQKLQPLMAKIREKHKNNKQQMNRELMALYKTYRVNPMGGCLPMLIQIPVFFALFRLLGNSIELRHAPFMLWINDLSAPDRLFNFSFPIPFMSPPSGIPVLTLLMGASMFIQQKMMPSPGNPAQVKMMMVLPFLFTAFFINFPSGMVLYWLINNILSIGQQFRVLKKSD